MAGPRRQLSSLVVILVVVVCSVVSSPAPSDRTLDLPYQGFQVLRLQSEDHETLARTVRSLEHNYEVDVWSRTQGSADVIVGPQQLHHVRDAANTQQIASQVLVEDLQRHLQEDFASRQQHRQKRSANLYPDVTSSYLTYDEMTNYLQTVASTATAADVTLTSIGQSSEGKELHVVQLRSKTNTRSKRAILIDAGIHAREWIAPAMALNIIEKLAHNTDNDREVTDLLDKFDWYIVPLVNPDGYVYSHSGQSGARLWRKTRSPTASGQCKGVDANRNFGYEWNPQIGGSTNPCSSLFAGANAFSVPETRSVRDWMHSHQGNAAAYISIHSFGEYVLYPYGHNQNAYLQDKQLNIDVANAFASQMGTFYNQYGKKYNYKVGNSANLLYAAAGGSDDYAKSLDFPVSYTLEMSPQSSWPGFQLDESQVYETTQHAWTGFKAMTQRLFAERGYPTATSSLGSSSTSTTTTTTTTTASPNQLVPVQLPGGSYIYVNPGNLPFFLQWLSYYRMRNSGN